MTVFVDIAVDIPRVDATFTYHLPPELEAQVDVGHLVVVPFGKQTVPGVVVERGEERTVTQTRAVESVLDPLPVVTPQQIALARHMAQVTLSPLAACLRLMLPPGMSALSDTRYRLTAQGEACALEDLTPAQQRLVRLLRERGPLRARQIERALPRTRWRRSAQALRRRGLLTTESVLRAPAARPQTEHWAALTLQQPVEAVTDQLGRAGSAAHARREAMLRLLRESGGSLPARRLRRECGGSLADLRWLETRGLVRLYQRPLWRDPLAGYTFTPSHPPPLTEAQRAAWAVIEEALQAAAHGRIPRPILLHGVTGSGKTEIYLRAIEHVLAQGKQAIFLVPEIALTPQTVTRVLSRFPGRVGLVHSQLSPGERYDTWRRARDGSLDVIVGPRSALFAPLRNLGLIVMDECHEDAYAQQDAPPMYHAREIAVAYARLWPAVCLMGSATPDVTSMHRVERGEWRSVSLPNRILAHRDAVARQMAQVSAAHRPGSPRYRPLDHEAEAADLPPVQVVDMRAELRAGNRSIFSRALQAALDTVLSRGEQAILFLNRRGTATYVFCRECGHALHCPRCDLPLTYHQPVARLTCHHCGYERRLPRTCPACGSDRIRHYGTGTERVEAEVQRLFPRARTLRWDRETTRRKGAHARILAQFAAGQADVLIGTQMLAKGLDLPLVTLVGVVLAEVGLNLPDYRAGERVFQVLTQVAGRAGRSPLGGQVILQTFQPAHYVIQAAARHDYALFYQREIRERARLEYPPFAQLVRLLFRDTDEEQVRRRAFQAAEKVSAWAQEAGRSVTLIGPAPCFFARRGGLYRWHLILRGSNVAALLRGRSLDDEVLVEVNPVSLL